MWTHESWVEIQNISQIDSLRTAALKIPDLAKASKAKNTNKKYDAYFSKFANWCIKHNLQYLPANVSTVSVFLSDLTLQNVSSAVLDGYFYSINWKHQLSLHSNPCENKLVKLVYDGSRRILSKPSVQKQPITVNMLHRIVELYDKSGDSCNLKDIRICTMCILGFSGFLRFSELSSLQMKDIVFHENHMTLNIKKSKTDQLSKGSEICIARTRTRLCPVSWLERYIAAAGLTLFSSEYIFTSVRFLKRLNKYVLANTSTPLSYTRTREVFLEAMAAIGEKKELYGLHSLRRGGASSAVNNGGISDSRLLNNHGRWKSAGSSDRYVDYSLENKLKLSKHLGI